MPAGSHVYRTVTSICSMLLSAAARSYSMHDHWKLGREEERTTRTLKICFRGQFQLREVGTKRMPADPRKIDGVITRGSRFRP